MSTDIVEYKPNLQQLSLEKIDKLVVFLNTVGSV